MFRIKLAGHSLHAWRKESLYNRHMVGLSAWQAFISTTRLSLHEKKVLIIGYGQVGQGCAFSAKAFGGQVVVAERDPSRSLIAAYDGWHTQALSSAIKTADVIVTATGAPNVVTMHSMRFPMARCLI